MKRFALASLASVVLSVMLSACAKMEAVPGDEAALLERQHSWEENFNKADVPKVTELYALDSRLLMTGGPPIEGPTRIQSALESMVKSGVKIRLAVDDHLVGQDKAFVHGHYTVYADATSEKELEHGDYVEVWRKIDGVWKIAVDMSVAAPSGPAQ